MCYFCTHYVYGIVVLNKISKAFVIRGYFVRLLRRIMEVWNMTLVR